MSWGIHSFLCESPKILARLVATLLNDLSSRIDAAPEMEGFADAAIVKISTALHASKVKRFIHDTIFNGVTPFCFIIKFQIKISNILR